MVGVVKALVCSCSINLIGAQKRSGFVATLLTLTAFGRAKARRDICGDSGHTESRTGLTLNHPSRMRISATFTRVVSRARSSGTTPEIVASLMSGAPWFRPLVDRQSLHASLFCFCHRVSIDKRCRKCVALLHGVSPATRVVCADRRPVTNRFGQCPVKKLPHT